jgi:hypothetical protein
MLINIGRHVIFNTPCGLSLVGFGDVKCLNTQMDVLMLIFASKAKQKNSHVFPLISAILCDTYNFSYHLGMLVILKF